MDLRVGGASLQFRFSELTPGKTPRNKDDSCEILRRVTQCDSPRLLSYIWGDDADASEVTFELTQKGNEVLLVMTHRRLVDLRKMISVASGWHTHVDILADCLSGRDQRPFCTTKTRMEKQYGNRS
jgi:hypothetical protein